MFTDALEQMLEVVTFCLENKHESEAITTFEVMDDLIELVRAYTTLSPTVCVAFVSYARVCCVCVYACAELVALCGGE